MPEPQHQRICLFKDLKPRGVPFARKHITTLEKQGRFPQHFDLSENTVAWVTDEIDSWVEGKIRSRAVVPLNNRQPPRPIEDLPQALAAAPAPGAPPRPRGRPRKLAAHGSSDPAPGARIAAAPPDPA